MQHINSAARYYTIEAYKLQHDYDPNNTVRKILAPPKHEPNYYKKTKGIERQKVNQYRIHCIPTSLQLPLTSTKIPENSFYHR